MRGAGEPPDLRSLSLDELGPFLAGLGEKPYRARQIHRWLHQKGAASFAEMTDLPAALRRLLSERARLDTLEMADERRSADGTIKWKWRTPDGKFVESVYMPEKGRKTLCVSSQVGCAIGCTFCLTGTMGLSRNLTAGEIVDQVARANRRLVELGERPAPRPLTNLVFMGMGEPLHNYDAVAAALGILLSEDGPNFSHRRITVSTSGLVPQMRRLGEDTEVKLAVSLNATTDAQRDALMPLNRRWPLSELLRACRSFPMKRGRRITFEYVLLAGVNDSDADAARLARLVRGLPAKVNLIPYNENPGLGFEAPAQARVEAFRDVLVGRNVTAVIRKNRGRDISAACGQLAVELGEPKVPATPGLPLAPVPPRPAGPGSFPG
jgi:23S rRNA (adenine2503-C2)-methyltransferase